MKTRKRLFALVLALCLLLSMTVPAVWAEDGAEELSYSMATGSVKYDITHSSAKSWGSAYTQYAPNTAFAINENFTYLNQSASNNQTYEAGISYPNRTWVEGGYATVEFYGPADSENGQWISFQINVPKAGSYDMSVVTSKGALGGLVKAYVLDKAKYQEVIKDYNLNDSTVLTKAQNEAIYQALAEKNAILNNVEEGVLDSYKDGSDGATRTTNIGKVAFENSGDYVLLFRSIGLSEKNQGANSKDAYAYRMILKELRMVLVEAGSEDGNEPDNEPDSEPDDEPDNEPDNKPEDGSGEVPEEVVYNFDYFEAVEFEGADTESWLVDATGEPTDRADAIQDEYEEGILNWNYLDGYYTYENVNKCRFLKAGHTDKSNVAMDGFLVVRAKVGDWIAFTIKNPGAGVQRTVTVTHPTSKYGAGSSNIYILPSDTQDIGAAIAEAEAIGSVSYYNKDVASCEVPAVMMSSSTVGIWTPGDAEEYIFVIEATEADSTPGVAPWAYMYISSLIMGDGSNITFEPVAPEVVAEEVIRSSEFQHAAVGVNPANGHDYLYLFYRGSKMMVFDLDTRQKVDEETDCFNTPRGAYVDANGILWVCGANRFLYRYDPAAGTGERISWPSELFVVDGTSNGLGITGDADGKIYFGTYNRGYIGMYDPATKEFSQISGWLDIKDPDDSISDEVQVPDTMHAGFTGLVVDNGYIYMTVDGNKNEDTVTTHAIIKYSIAERKIVDHVDISECFPSASTAYLTYLTLVDDVLFCSTFSNQPKYCTVDVSGDDMKLIDIDGIKEGYWGCVSKVINGKAYLMGDCMLEYDVATRTVTPIEQWPYKQMRCYNNSIVTIEGDERLPGQSIVTVVNNKQTGSADVIFYNPQTREMVLWEGITAGEGSGNQLQNIAIDPSGENVYVSAYGNNQVAEYNVATGTITKLMPTYAHQTDGLFWYNGYLYGGNYSTGTITRIDVETGAVEPLFNLFPSAFEQKRMHAMTAGDNKVFAGPTPESNMYGGVLVWYDMDQELTYVAAGPNPEDVYYADTSNLSVPHVWYSALTGEKADFDQDDDGVDDCYITLDVDADGDGELDKEQRFSGLIANQTINCIVYKDGYIYGSTSKHGGSGTTLDKYDDCATLFVYDVAAMKVIGTYDLCDTIEGLKAPIEMIEVIAEDPDVDGKFWGVVSNTLFSFTFDPETGFSVKEELSFGKQNYYAGATSWGHRSIVFDGDYMYVVFGGAGTFMINRTNVEERYLLAIVSPRKLVLAEDGNLYGYVQGDLDLSVLRVADITQPMVAESVQARIDALPETVTEADDAAVAAVRKAYDALSDVAKEMVDTTKLEAAEAVLAPNRAEAVEALINAIGTVTLESGKVIRTAREAYDALLDGEKALVTNLSTLTAAETALAALKDAAKAARVQALIDAIGTVTLESEAAIKEARTAYDALTDSQKAYVTNLDVLTAAETALAALQNPKTGDMTNMAVFAAVLITSAAALSVVLVSDIRRKHI